MLIILPPSETKLPPPDTGSPLDLSRLSGRPAGLDDQTVTLRIRAAPGGPARLGDVIAKRVRGEAASHLLSSGAAPGDPLDIADILATRWSIEVEPPAARNRTWTVTLLVQPVPDRASIR